MRLIAIGVCLCKLHNYLGYNHHKFPFIIPKFYTRSLAHSPANLNRFHRHVSKLLVHRKNQDMENEEWWEAENYCYSHVTGEKKFTP